MKTIKLPVMNEIDIYDYQRVYSSIVRFSYNRFKEGMDQKEIRQTIKLKEMFNDLDTWFIQSAIYDGKAMFDACSKIGVDKPIFGGKKNWYDYINGKISKEEYKANRLMSIYSVGAAPTYGNRNFELDIIANNKIVFKPERNVHIDIQLPKLRKNIKNELYKLEQLTDDKKMPFSVKLDKDFIYITFDECLVSELSKPKDLMSNRVLGIDLNPNYIGYSILEFNPDKTFNIIHKEVIDLNGITINSHEHSSTDLSKYLVNKHQFELIETMKYIVNIAKSYKCSKIIIEELNIKPKNHKKGRRFNRMVNNKWNRTLIVNNLLKRCRLNNIELVEVNPAYSSLIGNLTYTKEPDMVASSIEVARRGYFKYQKGTLYPVLIGIDALSDLWKEKIEWSFKTWKELSDDIKSSKLKYRTSLADWLKSNSDNYVMFFRSSHRSHIKVYNLLYENI
jgi:IS605 OrfB family transposase